LDSLQIIEETLNIPNPRKYYKWPHHQFLSERQFLSAEPNRRLPFEEEKRDFHISTGVKEMYTVIILSDFY